MLVTLLLLWPDTIVRGQNGPIVTVWAGMRPSTDKARSLLFRISGSAAGVDHVRVELPDRKTVEGARTALLPSGWKPTPKGSRIDLAGPTAPLPVYVRVDLSDPKGLDSVDVTVYAGKRVIYSEKTALAQVPALDRVHDAADLVLLPPLLTPGETIEMTVLDSDKTVGVWSLGGNEAAPAGTGDSARPMLSVRIPPDAAPGVPLDLSFVEPWGETIVRASVQEQARIVPSELPVPSSPHVAPCGLRTAPRTAVCTCGWFPTAASRHEILVDGAPSGAVVAASQRSVCLHLEPGQHRIAGAASAGFAPENQQKVTALRLSRSMVGSLLPGQSATITWTVTGTNGPLGVQLRNTSPAVGMLVGGEKQIAVTSGGSPNTVSRTVTGVADGHFNIIAEIDQPLTPSGDQEYPRIIEAIFRRELTRIVSRIETAAREWPSELRGSPPRDTVPRDNVIALLDETEIEVRRALPYPELAAFRDAVSELLDDARHSVAALPDLNASAAIGGIVRVANQSSSLTRVEKESAMSIISKLLESLTRSPSPLRTVCIVTTPESGARVRMYPSSFPSDLWEGTSNAGTTLYLGRYVYEITKGDNLPMKGSVNLVRNPERLLECPLSNKPNEPTFCRLVTESQARCP